MEAVLYLVFPLVVIVFFLIKFEFEKDFKKIYIFKPASTILVIITALVSFLSDNINYTYTIGILIGLVFSFGGDILLMVTSQRKAFLFGLISFLLAHISYSVTFLIMNGFYFEDFISGIILICFAIGIYFYLRSNLGKMKGPVIIYILIITFMVNRAVSIFYGTVFTQFQAWIITIGAILFFISDLILAVSRFKKEYKYNRISLLFYYSGQYLIALAASFFIK